MKRCLFLFIFLSAHSASATLLELLAGASWGWVAAEQTPKIARTGLTYRTLPDAAEAGIKLLAVTACAGALLAIDSVIQGDTQHKEGSISPWWSIPTGAAAGVVFEKAAAYFAKNQKTVRFSSNEKTS